MCGYGVFLLVKLGFGAGLFGSDRRLHVNPWLLDAADTVLLHHKKGFVGMVDVDLVRGVSANHVQDSQTASRVVIDPFGDVQGVTLVYDDGLALCDQFGDGLRRNHVWRRKRVLCRNPVLRRKHVLLRLGDEYGSESESERRGKDFADRPSARRRIYAAIWQLIQPLGLLGLEIAPMHGSGARNLTDGAACERHGAEYLIVEFERTQIYQSGSFRVQGPYPNAASTSLSSPRNAYLSLFRRGVHTRG